MRSLLLLILLTLVLSLNARHRKGKREKLTKDAADKLCKLNFDSELLSLSKLTNPSVLQAIDSSRFLKDGDSAWMSGHVTFSLPIVYRGCYEPKSNNFVVFDPVEFEIKSIYSCICLSKFVKILVFFISYENR